jgi:hypothetical protein
MATPEIYTRRIPEQQVSGKPLGRHVRHDPRSLSYLVPAADPATLTSVHHDRHVPVLDQGSTGSCTGNAAEGAVGTGALYDALAGNAGQPTSDADHDEEQAVALYSAATALDDYPGTYPPDDTGSDGLSVAKAAKNAGLISGYRHATSLNAALTALATQAVITGVNWYDSFDDPDSDGLVAIPSGAQVRGGHEFVVDELDVERRLVGFTNSWGTGWGVDGRAYMSWDTWSRLLGEEGDVTVFVPVTEPAPTPAPPKPSDPLHEFADILKRFWSDVEGWFKRL